MGDLLLGFAVEEEFGRGWSGREGVYGNFAAAEFFREGIGQSLIFLPDFSVPLLPNTQASLANSPGEFLLGSLEWASVLST